MNPNLTEIVCIVDRSGSMEAIQSDAEGGLNTFIEEQKKFPGEARLTIAQFDTEYEIVCSRVLIKDAPKYRLRPRGNTALLDALGRTITTLGEQLSKTAEADRPSKIVVVIVTDGMENSSLEYKASKIFEMITHQREKYSWAFMFLAANQDAIKTATGLGMSGASSVSYAHTGVGVRRAYAMASSALKSYRSSGDVNDLTLTPDADDKDDDSKKSKPRGKNKSA